MKLPILLRIYNQEALEGVKQFTIQQIVIGRNADLQVVLADDQVAPLHAMIEERESGYFVSDLGSSAGTFRNGQKILDEKIESGDELRIGPYRLQFFIGVPKPASPPQGERTVTSIKPISPKPTPAAPPTSAAPPTQASIPTSVSTPSALPPKTVSSNFSSKASQPPKVPTPGSTSTPVSRATPTSAGAKAAVTAGTPSQVFGKGKGLPAPAAMKKSKKHGPTFAPPSAIKDLRESLRPSKGSVVEVLVAWRERIIASYHFSDRRDVTISSDPTADVIIPLLSSKSKYQLIKIGTLATVCLTQDMSGELIREGGTTTFAELSRQNRLRNMGGRFEVDLNQGEMIRVGLQNDLISVFIRYVPEPPKPMVAPLLDLTASEVTGVILATVVAAIFGLYMAIYAPADLEDEKLQEEQLRKAVVTFNAPPKKIVQVEEKPVEKKVVQIVEKQRQTQTPTAENSGKPGQTGEVAPKNVKDQNKKLTSARPGGAIKTSPTEGASAKSDKPDPTKVGLLSVFANKGTQSKLDKAYSGAGELQGMADAATGTAGNAENREGDTLGTKLKDTGAGGKGTSTVGIAGVGTKGKGSGSFGYGTGGIGQKGAVEINVGGQDALFEGTIDREAIRRVIRENIRSIRNCYERELQRQPDMYGKLVLEWDIEEKGRVTRAVVKSNSLGNTTVASCIVSRLKTWTFPEPPADQVGRVTYPFVFTSQ